MFIYSNFIVELDFLNALLRHMRLLINFFLCFPKLLRPLIKVRNLKKVEIKYSKNLLKVINHNLVTI
jgi:hypothetical protein